MVLFQRGNHRPSDLGLSLYISPRLGSIVNLLRGTTNFLFENNLPPLPEAKLRGLLLISILKRLIQDFSSERWV